MNKTILVSKETVVPRWRASETVDSKLEVNRPAAFLAFQNSQHFPGSPWRARASVTKVSLVTSEHKKLPLLYNSHFQKEWKPGGERRRELSHGIVWGPTKAHEVKKQMHESCASIHKRSHNCRRAHPRPRFPLFLKVGILSRRLIKRAWLQRLEITRTSQSPLVSVRNRPTPH